MSEPVVNSESVSTETEKTPAQDTTQAGASPEPVKAAESTETKAESQPSGNSSEEKKDGQSASSEQKPAVPEKYELKLPEGSLLDASQLDQISSYAKEQGLTNEQAQSLLERQHEAVSSFAERQKAEFEETKNRWFEASKSDPEIGGDAFAENAELAKRAIERFGSEALKTQMNATGFGNHPEVVRAFAKIGRAMANDTIVKPGAQSPGRTRSVAERLYGDNP